MRRFPKLDIIRNYGKCKIRYVNETTLEINEKEITEEEFFEYKRKWKPDDGYYTIYDYNDTSDIKNPNVFTYSWEYDKPSITAKEEINISKNKVVCFNKIVTRDINGKEEPPLYEVTLRDNVQIYLPNEDIYNSFCKWMKS